MFDLQNPNETDFRDINFRDGISSEIGDESFEDDVENGFALKLIQTCEKLLGVSVVGANFPGGSHRASFVVELKDSRTVVITRREDQHRALLEERVMSVLRAGGASVPEVLAFNGIVLVQSFEGEVRLSETLLNSDWLNETSLLEKSAESLLVIHNVASELGLAQFVPMLGTHEDWVKQLIDRPALIGGHLGIDAPEPDLESILDLLMLSDPAFVKWDARPANAVLNRAETVNWIDWEHCGARNPLDDLVRLFCDETVSCSDKRDVDLVNEYAPRFSGSMKSSDATEYLRVAGTFHMCVRLALILGRYEKHGWAGAHDCASEDKIGSSKLQFLTLCARGSDWASRSAKTETLSRWFEDVGSLVDRHT